MPVSFLGAQTALIDTILVADQLQVPWDIEWMGNDQIMVTERGGTISRIDLATQTVTSLLSLDVAEEIHSGLMGLALHHQWPDSNAVFAVYSYYDASFNIFMKIERFGYDASNDTLNPEYVLVDQIPGAGSTTGARLLMSDDGFLFASTGDLDNGILAQDSSSLNGKILRMLPDGSIPADNPISGSPVFSLGHRNPQGLAVGNGRIYASEHGPSSTDEVNIIENGRNYGWPQVLGPCDASTAQVCMDLNAKDPLITWSSPPIAPAGMAWYPDSGFQAWGGSLLMTTLRQRSLVRMILNESGDQIIDTETYLTDEIGRIRDVEVTPDGRIFVCTSNRDLFGTPKPGDDIVAELVLSPVSIRPELLSGVNLKSFGNGQWEISLPEDFPGGQVSVIDIQGRRVHVETLDRTGQTVEIDLQSESAGMYVIHLQTPYAYWSEQIIHE